MRDGRKEEVPPPSRPPAPPTRPIEIAEALNLADGLARSPASIASFLEAAGSAALELAGKILLRGTLTPSPSPRGRGE